ncbi:MAG: cobalamin biosynthesis protein CbiX [Candidatus Hydrogenedentes bacterium]|nr:cobalamin biosynthesis protein CbiX [Candidatus Hydrogenedentota bacterium]
MRAGHHSTNGGQQCVIIFSLTMDERKTKQLGKSIPPDTGIVLVDHGSKLEAANLMLEEVAKSFAEAMGGAIVEPAHMELAEPTIAQAFEACIERGARRIVVQPYFLSPGRHSRVDIPRITAEAAARFEGIAYVVGEPLGVDANMNAIILRRILEAMD